MPVTWIRTTQWTQKNGVAASKRQIGHVLQWDVDWMAISSAPTLPTVTFRVSTNQHNVTIRLESAGVWTSMVWNSPILELEASLAVVSGNAKDFSIKIWHNQVFPFENLDAKQLILNFILKRSFQQYKYYISSHSTIARKRALHYLLKIFTSNRVVCHIFWSFC